MYFSLHNHTEYSNASRAFADSSIKLKDLILRAKELGLRGIAITDHEITGSFAKAKKLEEELDFPIILGNEIYLVTPQQNKKLREEYKKDMYFPHFILLALDKIGAEQLWELSSIAWENAFQGTNRTPTLTTDLERIINQNKGHIVASTACLGGQLGKWVIDMSVNPSMADIRLQQIVNFIKWGRDLFGEDNFYLEMQPATEEQKEQRLLNEFILKYSKKHNVPYIITTDSHYLKRELLSFHSAFLNSKPNDDRETEKFYRTAYLMSEEELRSYFDYFDKQDIDRGLLNTIKIGERVKKYSLTHKQIIPKIPVPNNYKIQPSFFPTEYVYIHKFLNSPYEQDRYLMYLINKGITEKINPKDYKETFERIELEVTEFWHISEQLEDRISAYFVTMSKLIDLCWEEANAIVGTGRGSGVSSVINYLLNITQINPLKMPVPMPFWRFMDRERPDLPDIDFDTPEHKRSEVYNAVKNYYESIGGRVVKCSTYGTIGSKSAILTAGRGLGYTNEEMSMISSLIPVERGATWSLKDCYFGNKEKNRKPITEFIKAMEEYKGLFDLASLIEGLIINRGTHASGVFLSKDLLKHNAIMRSPDGTLTTQYELHDSESMGLVKYDYLTTSALSKIQLTLETLIKDGYIKWKGNLKDTYFSTLDPQMINFDRREIWDSIAHNEVLDLFQFDTPVGKQSAAQIKPQSLIELAQANSLMRLMPKGAKETPTETYVRFKNDINEWYRELKEWNIPDEYITIFEELMLPYKGVLDTQEAMMIVSQHPSLTNFTVGESNILRKAVAKKQPELMVKVEKMFYEKGLNNNCPKQVLDYIWNVQIGRQLMYSFSILHTIAYTFIALQELILFHDYPSIYWNTACLTVNAGAIETDIEGQKSKSTKYGKVAKAIGDLQQMGIEVALPDVNKAEFSFTPDVVNNRILYSLKGLNGISDELAYLIVNNRPYISFNHFCEVMKDKGLGTTKMITLIKAGVFDEVENRSRIEIMKDYINSLCNYKTKLTMSGFKYLVQHNLVPEEYAEYVRIYRFREYVFSKTNFYKQDSRVKSKNWYILNGTNAKNFFETSFMDEGEEDLLYTYSNTGELIVCDKEFDKIYKRIMSPISDWLKLSSTLNLVNCNIFEEKWEKYCNGNVSKWEMDSVSFYHAEHELQTINTIKYGIVDFYSLPEEPRIIKSGEIKSFKYNIYDLQRIAGTVLDKDSTKHTVTLLTTTGVVTCKFYIGLYSYYDKQITIQVNQDQQYVEKSWFTRGNLLLITGYRQGDNFIPKKYKQSIYKHCVAKIEEVEDKGDLFIKSERGI